jgi:hypothetical protein
MAPCLGYIDVAQAARTALTTASSQNFRPSFFAPPTIAFHRPDLEPLLRQDDVQLTARATDQFGVASLDCTDGASPLALSTTSSNGGIRSTARRSSARHRRHAHDRVRRHERPRFRDASGLAALDLGRHRQDAAGFDRELLAGAERRWLELSPTSASRSLHRRVSGVATNTAAPAQLVTTEARRK